MFWVILPSGLHLNLAHIQAMHFAIDGTDPPTAWLIYDHGTTNVNSDEPQRTLHNADAMALYHRMNRYAQRLSPNA
jgi:hypothetical protein